MLPRHVFLSYLPPPCRPCNTRNRPPSWPVCNVQVVDCGRRPRLALNTITPHSFTRSPHIPQPSPCRAHQLCSYAHAQGANGIGRTVALPWSSGFTTPSSSPSAPSSRCRLAQSLVADTRRTNGRMCTTRTVTGPCRPTWFLRLSHTQSPLPPRLASPPQLRLQPHLVLSRLRPRPAQSRLPPGLVHPMIPILSTQTRFSPRTGHPWTGILPSKPRFAHRPAPLRLSPAQSSLQPSLPPVGCQAQEVSSLQQARLARQRDVSGTSRPAYRSKP